ncbi:hypothetical protein LAV82_23170 [Bacillus sp. ILBB4]|nr:hypothetical protein [Bacillus sp. ILBB4]
MLSSNQPYHRVDDGIGAGVVAGSVIGGAAAGASHMWGGNLINGYRDKSSAAFANAKRDFNGAENKEAAMKDYQKANDKHTKQQTRAKNLSSAHSKGFSGGWKGKAAAYGGSVLAGGILGGFIDGANN